MRTSYVQASEGGRRTSTPLFMACDVMKRGKHSIGTELETVLYVIIFILSNGVVTWRHIDAYDHLACEARVRVMTVGFEDRVLVKVPPSCHKWLRRLRDLVSPGNPYYNPK